METSILNKPTLKTMKWKLFLLGLFKIPIVGYIKPRLLQIDDESISVKIKLRKRTKNHLNSMYFGALAVGADIAGGLHAFYFSESLGEQISFAFKGMNANFIKRAESHIIFKSSEGRLIQEAVLNSQKTKKRVNQNVKVEAINSSNEIIAEFIMIVSVKVI